MPAVSVGPNETISAKMNAFGAKIANPFVDVGTTIWNSTRNGYAQYFQGKDYIEWYSYKADQNGFYRNTNKYGNNGNDGSPERAAELITNTVSVNMTAINAGY